MTKQTILSDREAEYILWTYMDRGTWGLEEKQIDMGFLSLSTNLNVYYKKKKKKKKQARRTR